MKKLILSVALIAASFTTFAQVGVGTTVPHASAALEVQSATQGFLPPRMTEVQIMAVASPAEGLITYCTDCTPKGIYVFDGSNWGSLAGGAGVVSPSYTPVSTFVGSWEPFGSTNWTDAGYYQDGTSGTVYLQGLTKSGAVASGFNPTVGEEIFTLPAGMRPAARILFDVTARTGGANENSARVDIHPDGNVYVIPNANFTAGDVMDWVSLDGIVFNPGATYTAPTYAGSWEPFGSTNWTDAGYYQDATSGTVYLQGLTESGAVASSFNPTVGEEIFTLPAGMRPAARILFDVTARTGGANENSARVDIHPDGNVYVIPNANFTAGDVMDWVSLDGIVFNPGATYTAPTYAGSWEPFGSTNWTDAGYYQDATSGTVYLQGLTESGAVASGSNPTVGEEIFTLPAGMRPAARILFDVTARTGGANENSARVDIHPDGNVYVIPNANFTAGDVMDWVSLNNVNFKAN